MLLRGWEGPGQYITTSRHGLVFLKHSLAIVCCDGVDSRMSSSALDCPVDARTAAVTISKHIDSTHCCGTWRMTRVRVRWDEMLWCGECQSRGQAGRRNRQRQSRKSRPAHCRCV